MKLVVFDMDGTLIDSKKDITISVNYVRKTNHNLPPLSEEEVVNAINKKERNLAFIFYKTDTYEDRDRELFEKHYKQQCITNPYLYDGIKDVFDILKQNNIKIAVATNAPTKFAKTMLSHLGVENYFCKIIGADKVPPKPDPSILFEIFDACGFDRKKDTAYMVGDNPKDIEVAKNAGIEAIYSTWGFKSDFSYSVTANAPKDILKIVL